MNVRCEDDISKYIERFEFEQVTVTAEDYQIKVKNENQAMEFLKELVNAGVRLIKFELREPSLHEIFVEKVGSVHEE